MGNVRLAERPLIIAVIVGFALWIVLQILEQALWVLVLVLLAIILAAALMPIVNVLRSAQLPRIGWRIPRALAVVIIYVVSVLLFGLVGQWVGRLLINDLLRLFQVLPEWAAELVRLLEAHMMAAGITEPALSPQDIFAQVQALTRPAVDALRLAGILAGGVVRFFFQFFIVLMLALFLVVESERILAFWVNLFPPSQRDKVHEITVRIGDKLGYWVLAQVTVAVIVGTLSGIIAALFGLPYPVLIGLATALLDIAPLVGPGLMVIPVFLLGLSQSLIVAIVAAVVFYGLAQLDGNVISPLITGRAVRVSPTLIIISLTLGLALYGALGVLVAVPVTAALQVVFHEVLLPWLRAKQGVPPEEQG